MAKYLVILKMTISDDDGSNEANATIESTIDCNPDDLAKKITDKKEYLEAKGQRKCDSEETCIVTVVQVLPL